MQLLLLLHAIWYAIWYAIMHTLDNDEEHVVRKCYWKQNPKTMSVVIAILSAN